MPRLAKVNSCLHTFHLHALVFSVLQLIGQVLMTARSMSLIVVLYLLDGNRVVMLIIQSTQTYTVDIICLTAPISLMVTRFVLSSYLFYFFVLSLSNFSKKVRKEYAQFFFQRQ